MLHLFHKIAIFDDGIDERITFMCLCLLAKIVATTLHFASDTALAFEVMMTVLIQEFNDH